jgi:repressor of nif and glnA expression
MKTLTKNDFETMLKIAKRAEKMGLSFSDRLTLMIDLEFATEEFNLKLEELLKADNFNFSHDICGIQNNINRRTKKFENCFLPRYSS